MWVKHVFLIVVVLTLVLHTTIAVNLQWLFDLLCTELPFLFFCSCVKSRKCCFHFCFQYSSHQSSTFGLMCRGLCDLHVYLDLHIVVRCDVIILEDDWKVRKKERKMFQQVYIGVADHLWGKHCQRDFKDAKLQEYESWREMYMRMSEEREVKLQRLTKSIVSAHSSKPKGMCHRLKI